MAKTFLDIQNLRASKTNDVLSAKIGDVDLARFYNEVVSDMSKYALKNKKVITNLVANQAPYTSSVLPGLVATTLVRVNGQNAPFIKMDDIPYATDHNTICHTLYDNSVVIFPTPTAALTNGLEVHYLAKLPEIIDAAVASTSLVELDDKDWSVVVAGITYKMYEKIVIYLSSKREDMIDIEFSVITKFAESLYKIYQDKLDEYGNQANFQNSLHNLSAAARDNEIPAGIGRQNK